MNKNEEMVDLIKLMEDKFKKLPDCYECGSKAYYEIEGKYYCEDCAWEYAKGLDDATEEIETTAYYVGGEFVCNDDIQEAIEEAFEYMEIDIKKLI